MDYLIKEGFGAANPGSLRSSVPKRGNLYFHRQVDRRPFPSWPDVTVCGSEGYPLRRDTSAVLGPRPSGGLNLVNG